jgi:AsmA protein
VKFFRSRRGLAALVALLLVLFLFRPAVYHLRNRIASSIGSALGRRVEIGNVRLRVLPRPGFDLEGLVIYDDPAFSFEPMIRAQEVSAAIRLRSLLHGRIEIATLSANEPSINLVRNDQGRWNLASLVERNAQIPAAPTGKPASERRPAFPYLEADHARVNFKIGQTKKSYALMDADVALWQDSENSWAARIKAEPVRTDINLSDTGLVQINATWQRARNLRSTPMQLAVQWQQGQLGQITKLLSGRDRGWRGSMSFAANLSGTPEALRIESQAAIDDFRRYDIVDRENVRLTAHCSGKYSASTNSLADLLCESPVNGGMLRLRGMLSLAAERDYDLTVAAEKVPLTSVVRLLRHAKKQLPNDLTANGMLDAEFHATRNGSSDLDDVRHGSMPQWTGTGSATNVRLFSNSGKDEVAFGTIPLALVSGAPLSGKMSADSAGSKSKHGPARTITGRAIIMEEKAPEPVEPHLRIGPVALSIGASAPVSARGWVSAAGYRFFLLGDTKLADLFRLENALGLPGARPAAEGEARLDVSVSGLWQGFAPPASLGTAQLRNVRAAMRGLNTPIEIASATVTLAPDTVSLQKISARTGSTRWTGGVTAPRHCAAPDCVFQCDLTADQFSATDLAEWFTPHPLKQPWYRILNSNANSNLDDPLSPSPLLAIQARGNLHVGQFALKKLLVTQIAAQVELDRGKITLTNLRARLLEGTHQGNWMIDVSNHDASIQDATTAPVRYHGAGTLQNISLAQVGAAMNDAWITGTADGNFELDGSGVSFRDFMAGSAGKAQFVMRNGSLPYIEIPGAALPLPVHRLAGELHLAKGVWGLSAGQLESRDGIYQVNGTASAASGFDFVLTRNDDQTWALTGSLAKPHVVPGSRKVAKRTEADAMSVKP